MPEKIVSRTVYLLVFGALLCLTAATYGLAQLDLGHWNAVVALLIAATKASLVALFFMHVFYSSRLTRIILVSGLCWLVVMGALTLADYRSRSW